MGMFIIAEAHQPFKRYEEGSIWILGTEFKVLVSFLRALCSNPAGAPMIETVSIPPSKALPESLGTVKAASTSEIYNSLAEEVRKQVDGSDVIATNKLKNDMIMLSETHSKITHVVQEVQPR
ncbi:hypothetical protein PsorP6_002165 [Peronosclerospora sorghi]|uniref:Uncharacterized protein n=1 Tax=Peronosclerospora sorghi TaxID=230839 RepID=A0ACC0WRS9_9STRA|nr:hypothetical protein PsorP6_002165 [Peronosclerospora sorghi]